MRRWLDVGIPVAVVVLLALVPKLSIDIPVVLNGPLDNPGTLQLLALCLLVALAILYFYGLLFYASVVVALGANHRFTLAHYRVIFTEGLKAIRDTLVIAGAGMPLGGLLGVLVGYLVSRKAVPGRQAMEVVSMLNYALPGTIVGIAYLMAFNDPPLVLTGTALVIVACYVFRYSAAGIRATVATVCGSFLRGCSNRECEADAPGEPPAAVTTRSRTSCFLLRWRRRVWRP